MSNLTVQGLLSARKKELRNQAERQHHISNELQTMTWTKEDKAGRCYTYRGCLLYTSPSPRDRTRTRMPSSA